MVPSSSAVLLFCFKAKPCPFSEGNDHGAVVPLQLLIQGYFLRVSVPTEDNNLNWVLSMFKYFVSSPEDREKEHGMKFY